MLLKKRLLNKKKEFIFKHGVSDDWPADFYACKDEAKRHISVEGIQVFCDQCQHYSFLRVVGLLSVTLCFR